MRTYASLLLAAVATPLAAQEPVIDMHMHVDKVDPATANAHYCLPLQEMEPPLDHTRPAADQYFESFVKPICDVYIDHAQNDEELLAQTLDRMEANHTIAVLQGNPEDVRNWMAAAPHRFIPSVKFSVNREDHEDLSWMRELFTNGGFAMLGEVGNQYRGVAPNDPRMDAIWDLVAELDIPVGYHMGLGPPGITPTTSPEFRVTAGNPLLFEEVMVRHPNLRLSVQHMAMGFHDELKMMMWTYPTIYVELSGPITGSADFHTYLKDLINGGFENRILFGVDAMYWPDMLDYAIKAIEDAEYLTEEQKRKILYENAVRFMKLDPEETRRRALGEPAK